MPTSPTFLRDVARKDVAIDLLVDGEWKLCRVMGNPRKNAQTVSVALIGGGGDGYRVGLGLCEGQHFRLADPITPGDALGLTVSNYKESKQFSEETIAYTATVLRRGKVIASMSNNGHGGSDATRMEKGAEHALDDVCSMVREQSGFADYAPYSILEEFIEWWRVDRLDGKDLLPHLVAEAQRSLRYKQIADEREVRENDPANWTVASTLTLNVTVDVLRPVEGHHEAVRLRVGERELDVSGWGFAHRKVSEILDFLKAP